MNPLSLVKKLIRLFLDIEDDSEGILFLSPRQPVFSYLRAASALRRVRFLAFVFMILVPGWIVVDAFVFPKSVANDLALARLSTSVLFCALAIYTLAAMAKARWSKAYLSLVALLLIPTAFGLYVDSQIDNWMSMVGSMNEMQKIAFELYLQLPIIMVAGVALFPLSVLESAPLIILMAVLTAIQGVSHTPNDYLPAQSLAEAWAILIGGGAIALSTLLQLQYAWHMFRMRQMDRETGLLTHDTALTLLKLSWAARLRGKSSLAVSMVQLRGDQQVDYGELGSRVNALSGEGLFGVRWSKNCVGYIKLPNAASDPREQLKRAVASAHAVGTMVYTDIGSESFRSPLELLMVTEEKLKKARPRAAVAGAVA